MSESAGEEGALQPQKDHAGNQNATAAYDGTDDNDDDSWGAVTGVIQAAHVLNVAASLPHTGRIAQLLGMVVCTDPTPAHN